MPKVVIAPSVKTIPSAVKLSHGQFVRYVAQRFGVSQAAVLEAMKLLGKGVKMALSEGHQVMWEGVAVFEIRELAARTRYNPATKENEQRGASCRVHMRVSRIFTRDVLKLATARLEKFAKEHPVKDAKR